MARRCSVSRSISATLALIAAGGSLGLCVGCGDPVATLQKAVDQGKKAVAAGAPSAKGAGEAFSDDEAARQAAGGVSLGPDHAKRLYYQFVDARGHVAFVERLEDVPAQWRDRVGFVEMDSAPPLSPAMAEQTRDRRYAANSDKPRQAGARPGVHAPARIVLYSATWCGWCRKAKAHLDAEGIDYEIRDIDNPANLEELVAKTGQKGIPVLDVGGKVVTGFSPDQYDRLIREART